jgi:hypothetical protein
VTGTEGEHELARLADGSLPEDRRFALEARVADSAELAARLAEQERALAIVHSAALDTVAPAGLRARVDALKAPRRRRPLYIAGGVTVAAVLALVLLLVLPTGAGGPSVADAAALGALPAQDPPPPPRPGQPKLLTAAVEGLPFPSWESKFGWKTTGARSDSLHGRKTITVFYGKAGKRIAYTIVPGKALDVPAGHDVTREGTTVRALTNGDRTVVTWKRAGRTCVLSGKGVDPAVLVKLAAWHGKGAVPF